jgi:hypothetical protein
LDKIANSIYKYDKDNRSQLRKEGREVSRVREYEVQKSFIKFIDEIIKFLNIQK